VVKKTNGQQLIKTKRQVMKRRLFIFLNSCLAVSCLNAQSSNELDTVTVTNSYAKEKISSTGRNITIIKGDQFLKQPVHSVDELLRYLPGVEVQTRGAFGAQADIVLRGGTFQQVLVILDGVRLNDPNSGHFTSYIPIAPEEIDRIEILKGASSSIYGSEAVGGVIHIITKSFATRGHSADPMKTINAQASAGEYGLVSTSIGGTVSNGTTTVSGGLLTNKSDGQIQRGIRSYFNTRTASLSLSHQFNNGLDVALRSAYDDRDFAAQNFYTTFLSDTSSERVKTFWNQARIAYTKGNSKLSLDAGYKSLKDHFLYNPHSIANNNHSEMYQLLALYELKISDNDNFVTGAQFINKIIHSNDRGNHHSDEIAEFMSYSKRIDNFTINPSIRFDYVQDKDVQVVPQLNLSYRYNQLQFRASGGRTIRQADFTERFNNYNKTIVTGGRIGNPWLDAETSWSYEAGADYFMLRNLKLSTSFFQRYHHGLIDYVPTPYADMPRKDNLSPTGSYALAKNISKVTTTGAEMDVQFTKDLQGDQHVLATLGLAWLHSASSSGTPSLYISSHAKFLANFNLQYSINRFSISVNGVYKNRTPQMATGMKTIPANCFMTNGKLEYNILRSLFSAFAEVDNITGQTCSDLLGAQLPGRWISGGVKLSIR
jgi:iron complex outermembrane receptor protein